MENKFEHYKEIVKESYTKMKLKEIGWLEFSVPAYQLMKEAKAINKNLVGVAEEVGISNHMLHLYSKAYGFILDRASTLLDDENFIKAVNANASKIDKLRRLVDKQPEVLEGQDATKFMRDLVLADTITTKKMLQEPINEEDVKISDRDILHVELLIRIIHDKLKDISKDPRAQAELRIKLGRILHDCAVNMESVVDVKFAAAVQDGKRETLEILGDKE